MLLNVSNKIVGMQALHDDDNHPLFLAVEATAQSVVKPLIHGPAAGFRQGVVRLYWVVDYNNVLDCRWCPYEIACASVGYRPFARCPLPFFAF